MKTTIILVTVQLRVAVKHADDADPESLMEDLEVSKVSVEGAKVSQVDTLEVEDISIVE
jgi:hypothetical protein